MLGTYSCACLFLQPIAELVPAEIEQPGGFVQLLLRQQPELPDAGPVSLAGDGLRDFPAHPVVPGIGATQADRLSLMG